MSGVGRRGGRVSGRVGLAAAVLATSALALDSVHLDNSAAASSGPGRPFASVLSRVVLGDLVVAGNANVTAAGGLSAHPVDVDEEAVPGCVLAQPEPVCSDNSSSATLDVPAGAHVLEARLYVETTMPVESNPLKVLFDGPAEAFEYVELSDETSDVPKLYEARGAEEHASLLQAVWDVTALVRAGGAGAYTVADIPYTRTGMWEPYASWTIVAVYELDVTADLGPMGQPERARFAPRSVSWADGFALADTAPAAIELNGLVVPDVTPFAKAFHLVASTRAGAVDNLLYESQPLGNNHLAGPPPAVPGVVIGNDPDCNTVTDVFNDTICHLGTPVAGKNPAEILSGSDGRRLSSGAAVDMDVVRVPAHYVRPGQDAVRLTARTLGDQAAAVGAMAVSIDLPHGLPAVAAVAAGQRPTPEQLDALAAAAEAAATTTTAAPAAAPAAPATTAPATTAPATTTPATTAAAQAAPTTTQARRAAQDVEQGFVAPAVPPPDQPTADSSAVPAEQTITTETRVAPETTAAAPTEPAATEPSPTVPPPTEPPATAPPPTEPPATEAPTTAPPATDPPPTSAPKPASTTTTTSTTVLPPVTTVVAPPGATTTAPTTAPAGPTTTIAPSTTVLSSTIPDPDGDPITDVTEPPVETPSGRVVVPAGAVDPGLQRAITFPVAGPVSYGNDWGACRDGCNRAHKGIDVIGDRLQPILAMTDGVVDHLINHRTAGYGVALRDAEGWQYHVYHVNNDRPGTDDGGDDGSWRFAPGITDGAPVRAGQVIAWMGDSGNSEYSVPHAHVEIHRPDGTAVNPYWSLRLAQRRETCAAVLAAQAQAVAADPSAATTTTTTAAAPADGGQAAAATSTTAAAATTTTAAPTTTTTTVPDAAARAEQAEAKAWLEGGWKQPANTPEGWLPVEFTGGRPNTDNLAARMWIRAGEYIPVDAGALTVGDPRYEKDVNCEQPEEGIAPAIPAELGAILATIRQLESGGDYAAQARTSTASGAYQFVNGTWNGFGGYARAADAPPAVQDAAAVQLATSILNTNGGNVAAIPLVWYIGHVPVGDEMDTVPAAPGNVLTPREYQTRWLRIYAEKSGSIEALDLSDAYFTLNAPILACRTTMLELPADRVATLLGTEEPDEGSAGSTTTSAAPSTTAPATTAAPAAGASASTGATTTTTTVPAPPEPGTGTADGLLTMTSGYQADAYGRAVLPETDVCDPARQPPDAPPPIPPQHATGPY